MNSRPVAIFAIIVAAIVGGAIYFLNSDVAPHASQSASATPAPAPRLPEPTPPPKLTSTPPVPPPAAVPLPATSLPPPQLTEDDQRIGKILETFPGNTDQDHTNTAQLLINALPTLGKDGQVEAAQHISNLLSDDEFKRVMHIWKNPSFNPDVIEVLHTDLMNRDHKILLPALLDAVKLPNHPSHEEAKTTLQVFLDEDYGNDIPKWDAALKAYLKKEADEEAAALRGQ
jgi:hypothetical protein